MVKFGKNGSDATSAAIRLARAYTGRDRVAICSTQPFFSTDDWFMGTTAIAAGIPRAVKDLTVKFRYNDIQSVRDLFIRYPGEIACFILEAAKETDPMDGFLHATRKLCKQHGVVFILDEMITGFRWHNGGAQAYYDIDPDLSTFGKALGNGFSISALVGKREIMRLGGIDHDRERVFLISTTHGAESHGLAAALEVMRIYREQPVIETLRRQGERLAAGVANSISDLGLDGYFSLLGKPWCMVYGTRDQQKQPSQPFRTLFIQEALKRGLLAPSFIVSYAHTDADIDRTIEATHGALEIYRQALDVGVDKYLVGRPVKPVMRTRC
jgi:glutamate-1-semialdehyde 2,1-aminomutase